MWSFIVLISKLIFTLVNTLSIFVDLKGMQPLVYSTRQCKNLPDMLRYNVTRAEALTILSQCLWQHALFSWRTVPLYYAASE
ncbi:hypothetical protein HK25_09145 [Acetobacter sp. DsW_059]|nr:hypothetical protein HK25_09145 [Acetobacter sp. DsW_059]